MGMQNRLFVCTLLSVAILCCSNVLAYRNVTCATDLAASDADTLSVYIMTNRTYQTINVFHSCESFATCAASQCIPPSTSCGVCSSIALTQNDPYIMVKVSKSKAAKLLLLGAGGAAVCTITIDPATATDRMNMFFDNDCQPLQCSQHNTCDGCSMQDACSWCDSTRCVDTAQKSTCTKSGQSFFSAFLFLADHSCLF
eukprot:TRINITY_DN3644_c0_g3_i1.p2 TRINITY_DN3644_c0_g3~~TRINITY_DN3644_c0_g3_i1.p2  ORF type:complete len:198 (+),score=-2.18 TRINITY_DN3644_c0_g3_i1:788-1381(+)